MRGGFASRGVPEDALALATLETGVPVWALDADRVVGDLAVRLDAAGRLTLADDAGLVALLFAEPEREHAPGRETTALLLVAVQAPGVDDIVVEEAVYTAAAAMPTIDVTS